MLFCQCCDWQCHYVSGVTSSECCYASGVTGRVSGVTFSECVDFQWCDWQGEWCDFQ